MFVGIVFVRVELAQVGTWVNSTITSSYYVVPPGGICIGGWSLRFRGRGRVFGIPALIDSNQPPVQWGVPPGGTTLFLKKGGGLKGGGVI